MFPMRAKKDARLGFLPDFTGGLRFIPCFLAEARPFAFNPPLGFLPAFVCHAGDFAIIYFLFYDSGGFKLRSLTYGGNLNLAACTFCKLFEAVVAIFFDVIFLTPIFLTAIFLDPCEDFFLAIILLASSFFVRC
jgi:hypothetical protein